jgi:hypothetical protein
LAASVLPLLEIDDAPERIDRSGGACSTLVCSEQSERTDEGRLRRLVGEPLYSKELGIVAMLALSSMNLRFKGLEIHAWRVNLLHRLLARGALVTTRLSLSTAITGTLIHSVWHVWQEIDNCI